MWVFFLKYRGTEKGVLEELRILSKLEHDNILRYYNSWSEPAEYHKERDEELFHQSGISKSPASATGGTSTGVGTTVDEIVIQRGSRTTDSNLSDIIFESSSSGNQPAKSISKSSIDDTKSSQNDQPAKSISKSSIDDTKSSQNDQTEEKVQKRSKSYEYLFIVTGLCKNESLGHRLLPEYRSKNKIRRFDALYIFYQIVEGVRYLHNTMNMVTYFLILVLFGTLGFFRFIVI